MEPVTHYYISIYDTGFTYYNVSVPELVHYREGESIYPYIIIIEVRALNSVGRSPPVYSRPPLVWQPRK